MHPTAVSRFKSGFALVCFFCLLLNGIGAWRGALRAEASPAQHREGHVEWPMQWEGRPLRPLALSAVEQRFADGFPGTLARLTDGERSLVMRRVERPTRMLHPAADCYRAIGFRIEAAQLEQDAQHKRWRCFTATKSGHASQRVCERIEDAAGGAFTDTSAWYWAAATGGSTGPWQAVTVATPLKARGI